MRVSFRLKVPIATKMKCRKVHETHVATSIQRIGNCTSFGEEAATDVATQPDLAANNHQRKYVGSKLDEMGGF